ncbi:hypothetical protein GGI24_006340, partial [Coemansia furcata]
PADYIGQAVNDLDNADAQAITNSIGRLGYLTLSIIPMLASCASYAPLLASYAYSSYKSLNIPQAPQIPQPYASSQSQSRK